MNIQESAWDWAVLNSGLFGSVVGVLGAVALSLWITLYSLKRTERTNRTVAFEEAMLASAEELTSALVGLRYKLDPVFIDNWEHHVALGPEDVVAWMKVAYAHASALAVDHRDYTHAAENLSAEILLFTAAVRSATGRDAKTRSEAYGWPHQRDDSYDSVLQAADWALAKWADAILIALGQLRRGTPPTVQRPSDLSLQTPSGGRITTPEDFRGERWFPLAHLVYDVEEMFDDEAYENEAFDNEVPA